RGGGGVPKPPPAGALRPTSCLRPVRGRSQWCSEERIDWITRVLKNFSAHRTCPDRPTLGRFRRSETSRRRCAPAWRASGARPELADEVADEAAPGSGSG